MNSVTSAGRAARAGRPKGDGTVGHLARAKLNEVRRLAIGQPAPEIEGKDVDGKIMKLSDFRGRIVVLIFWGSWSERSMALVPQQRELLRRLQGKPFTLLGINSDDDRAQARKVMDAEGMTWRSWWDEKRYGPIAELWDAGPWPTVYVLDANGVIRYKRHGQTVGLDDAIESALKETQPPGKN